MMNPNDPAYPLMLPGQNGGSAQEWEWGLTKREYFAAMAMQGLLACKHTCGSKEDVAIDSVTQADALIAALNKDAK